MHELRVNIDPLTNSLLLYYRTEIRFPFAEQAFQRKDQGQCAKTQHVAQALISSLHTKFQSFRYLINQSAAIRQGSG
jgi:hypothetical protein